MFYGFFYLKINVLTSMPDPYPQQKILPIPVVADCRSNAIDESISRKHCLSLILRSRA